MEPFFVIKPSIRDEFFDFLVLASWAYPVSETGLLDFPQLLL
jgi:hypothetical protein